MVKYIVIARKWRDKVNGNTYHSVVITNARTNKKMYSSGMTYGYGEQYRHTALSFLEKKGLRKDDDRFNHEKNRKEIYFDVADVDRKKDLDLETFDSVKSRKQFDKTETQSVKLASGKKVKV